MTSLLRWTRRLAAGALALAVLAPAGAASAASYTYYYYYTYKVPTSQTYFQPVRQPAAPPRVQQPIKQPIKQPVKQQPAIPAVPAATTEYAKHVVSLVNQERAKAGLKALVSNAALSNMAMAKAKDMKNNNYFDHNSPTYGSPFDMMKKFGITYRYAGENIAMGQRTPQEVMDAWMKSPGHRANILNANYTSIGVAWYQSEWVQEFTG